MEIDEKTRQESLRIGRERMRHCAPAIVLPSIEARSSDIISSGTLSLVDTPTRQVFITAFHVWREFQRVKEEYPDAVIASYLGAGHGILALTEIEYLDGDEDILDVVVFHAPRAGYIRLLGKSFFRVPEWPIPRVVKGNMVDIVGYGGKDREAIGESILVFGNTHFGFGVSSVSDRAFVLAPDYGQRVFLLKNPRHGDQFDIGGMSGGPAFCSWNGRTHLVGFVRAGESSDKCIFVTHAAFLLQDGTLDHLAIPHG